MKRIKNYAHVFKTHTAGTIFLSGRKNLEKKPAKKPWKKNLKKRWPKSIGQEYALKYLKTPWKKLFWQNFLWLSKSAVTKSRQKQVNYKKWFQASWNIAYPHMLFILLQMSSFGILNKLNFNNLGWGGLGEPWLAWAGGHSRPPLGACRVVSQNRAKAAFLGFQRYIWKRGMGRWQSRNEEHRSRCSGRLAPLGQRYSQRGPGGHTGWGPLIG